MRLILASGIQGIEGLCQRWSLHGHLQETEKKYPALSSDYKLYEEVGQSVSATVYWAFCISFNNPVTAFDQNSFLASVRQLFSFRNIFSQSIAPIVGIVPHIPAVNGYMGDAGVTWPLKDIRLLLV